MTPSDLTRIEAIRERLAKATDGPWRAQYRRETYDAAPDWLVMFPDGEDASVLNEANASFIAHARDDVPWLLARLSPATAAGDE